MSTTPSGFMTRTAGRVASGSVRDARVVSPRQHRVPEWQLRRARQAIDRYRRMVHPYAAGQSQQKDSR